MKTTIMKRKQTERLIRRAFSLLFKSVYLQDESGVYGVCGYVKSLYHGYNQGIIGCNAQRFFEKRPDDDRIAIEVSDNVWGELPGYWRNKFVWEELPGDSQLPKTIVIVEDQS